VGVVAIAHTGPVGRWRRPYALESGFGLTLFLLCLAGSGAVVGVVAVLTGKPWSRLYTLLWLATAILARGVFVGLYISDTGVRIRKFWRTYTLAWKDVAGVTKAPAGLFGVGVDTICVLTRRKGRFVRIRTPIRRGLARMGMRQDVSVTSLGHRGVKPHEFEEVLRLMRARCGATSAVADSTPTHPHKAGE
jgi:hypothetical protein